MNRIWLPSLDSFRTLRRNSPAARTESTSLFTRTSELNWPFHPRWAPSLDASRTRQPHVSHFRQWTGGVIPDTRKSKLLSDTGLSQHCFGGVPGQDLPVYRKTPLRDWAVPDFMVTPSRSLKVTSMRTENLLHVRGVAGHQKVRTSLSSCWYSTWKLAVRSLGTPFNSSNSGIRVLSF